MAAASWVVEVDWRNDGNFIGIGEVVTTRVLNNPGLVFERGRDQIRALAPPMAGRCEFALNNASKDYSPEYASGPLYGNLLPGRLMRIRTTAPSAATLWAGVTDDLAQEPFLRGGGRVRVPSLGYLSLLKGVPVWIDVQENITTSDALALLFEAVALVEGEHFDILDTGQTTLTAWWCAGDDAFDMMRQLLAAEGPGAAIYEQAHGRIAFHSRHYRRVTARSNTSQVTFGNSTTEPKHSLPFTYQPNLKDVVNSVSLDTATLRFATSSALLATWVFDTPAYFEALEARDFTFVLDAPATDFNIDAIDATIAYSEGFSAGYGPTVTVTVTSASAEPGTIAAIELYGKRLETGTTRIDQTVDASPSQISYGVRRLPGSFSPWPYLTESAAQDLVNSVVIAYQEPRATVGVTIANANSTRLTQQLTREISDRVTVVEAQTGLNAAMYIERVRHEVREGGKFHRTTFGCEKVGPYDEYFLFDVDSFDGASFGF